MAQARVQLDRVIDIDPANAMGHYWLGALHGMDGNREAAIRHLSHAISIRPDFAAAHADLGNVMLLDGDAEAAIRCYRTALGHDPLLTSAYCNLARALRKVGQDGRALECLLKALELAPLEDNAFLELVRLMLEQGRADGARVIAEQQAAIHPERALVHRAAGLVALDRHDPEAALQYFQKARALAPPDADLWLTTGIALQELLHLDQALAAYTAALSIDASFAPARWRIALVRLLQGDFARGWPDYEARHISADRPRRDFPYPRWGGEPLQGRTILVYAEQGLGDEIMFASCLPDVIRAAGLCIIDCHPKLEPIFRRSFPGALVHGGEQTAGTRAWLAGFPVPAFQIPAGSLPLLLRRAREEFPQHAGYLRADPGRVEFWRTRLAALGPGLKVGISWKGGTKLTRAALRSLSLDALLPVLRTHGVRFVNLQYAPDDQELKALADRHGVHIESWPDAVVDYDETAALICAVDLVISVCTAVVHLGGALGCPVWVMAPYSPEWRYGHAGPDIPWYPSVRVYRQPGFRQWSPVIHQVASDLHHLAAPALAR